MIRKSIRAVKVPLPHFLFLPLFLMENLVSQNESSASFPFLASSPLSTPRIRAILCAPFTRSKEGMRKRSNERRQRKLGKAEHANADIAMPTWCHGKEIEWQNQGPRRLRQRETGVRQAGRQGEGARAGGNAFDLFGREEGWATSWCIIKLVYQMFRQAGSFDFFSKLRRVASIAKAYALQDWDTQVNKRVGMQVREKERVPNKTWSACTAWCQEGSVRNQMLL